MHDNVEIKVNARGLSTPGPRMMLKNALSETKCNMVRVIVSKLEAVEDVEKYLETQGTTVHVDQVGEEYHIRAEF